MTETSSEHTQNTEFSSKIDRSERDGIIQVVIVIAVLAAGFASNRFLASGSSAPDVKETTSNALVVKTIQPSIRDTQLRLNETGTVQVRNAIDLRPQVGGRVVYVSPNLASGGNFRSGEVLFRLDDSDYRASVDRALADLSAAEADLQVEMSESDIAKREWTLVNPDEPVPPNVAREPQIARAEANVQSKQAALSDARLSLQRIEYSLPFNGRILSTSIEVGQNLSSGQPYGQAYDPNEIEVSVPINAGALEGFSPIIGRSASVKRANQGLMRSSEVFSAIVSRTDAELDAQTRLARVILEFDEPVALLPGNFVDVELLGPSLENAYFIPEQALSEQRTVWVVDKNAMFPRQPELVAVENGELVTLPFDTADGVIVTPMSAPMAGDPVQVERRPTSNGEGQ